MISLGIRVGAWGHLKWKYVIPIRRDDIDKDEVVSAKLVVYGGEKEEYYFFYYNRGV